MQKLSTIKFVTIFGCCKSFISPIATFDSMKGTTNGAINIVLQQPLKFITVSFNYEDFISYFFQPRRRRQRRTWSEWRSNKFSYELWKQKSTKKSFEIFFCFKRGSLIKFPCNIFCQSIMSCSSEKFLT